MTLGWPVARQPWAVGSPPSRGKAFAACRLALGPEEFAVGDDALETAPLAAASLSA